MGPKAASNEQVNGGEEKHLATARLIIGRCKGSLIHTGKLETVNIYNQTGSERKRQEKLWDIIQKLI